MRMHGGLVQTAVSTDRALLCSCANGDRLIFHWGTEIQHHRTAGMTVSITDHSGQREL